MDESTREFGTRGPASYDPIGREIHPGRQRSSLAVDAIVDLRTSAPHVNLSPGDREVLESWTRSPSLRAGLAQRARIVLLAADGTPVTEIVRRVGVCKPTVLDDRPKSGRPKQVDEVEMRRRSRTLRRHGWG